MSILVQRSGALGDVILTTPIVRRLRRENPTESISVITAYGDVFRNNPHLGNPLASNIYPINRIDLDLAYEKRPELHIVQAYMQEAFGDMGEPEDRQQELFFPRRSASGRRCVAVHATVAGWANRTLPRATWTAVVEGLRAANLWPILVGTVRDALPAIDVSRFFADDILAQAQFISQCDCFVGSDSGLLHAAGATDTPIVGVFTCAKPELRLPWRHGQLGWKCTAITPDIDCIGCMSRRDAPVTTEFCERGDNLCVQLVQADVIVAAVLAAIE